MLEKRSMSVNKKPVSTDFYVAYLRDPVGDKISFSFGMSTSDTLWFRANAAPPKKNSKCSIVR